MIEFSGNEYYFEVFSYIFKDNSPINYYHMGRVIFKHNHEGIDYIEGILVETGTELISTFPKKNYFHSEKIPVITSMILSSILKIKLNDGKEIFLDKNIQDAEIGKQIGNLFSGNRLGDEDGC